MKNIMTCAIAFLGLDFHGIAAEKQNVIVILADDLGYADVGFQVCKDIPTPNLDAFAATGVRPVPGFPHRLTGLASFRFSHQPHAGTGNRSGAASRDHHRAESMAKQGV